MLIPIFIRVDPVDHRVGDNIGYITLHLMLGLRCNKDRVVVIPLPWQYIPVVKTCGVTLEVPLPDQGCFVSRFMTGFWVGRLRAIKQLGIGQLSVDMTRLSE